MDELTLQWILLIGFGLLFFFMAPYATTLAGFFSAKTKDGRTPNVYLLTSSLVISWIFAKSITNAANLGMSFGIVGGVAYGIYYFSFLIAGIIIYKLRTIGGFMSIHHFLSSKYGRSAIIVFSLLIGFRLFNEVWSNTMVIGSYFGAVGSIPYYTAVFVFSILTLAYSLKGGLRSSLITDAIQMVFFGVLLVLLLGLILPNQSEDFEGFLQSGSWTMGSGVNLLLAAFLQIFSYPFHDPVLTDRAFISDPKTTLKSFIIASFIGFGCIVVFSFVGIFAQSKGLSGQATVEVGKLLGTVAMLAMNFIMITSAASTLDSTFSSFSKLMVIDLGKKKFQTITRGRWMMVILVIVGTIPVFTNVEILSATTISGTMVMGLAPVFLFWNIEAPKISFHLSIGFGFLIGLVLAFGLFPETLVFTTGKYADLLWSNLWGLIGCFILFFIPILMRNGKK